ncbi:unnamed protein product [Brachionus calyciflorus]|uniref:MULE transposase domain-containing protein n=1 Tax=Brachionus calyciflorus TaxID=104777 RepID=A0A814GQ76_9BILA|nr:unnamed protein product [Brachionus calyciflorus]
MEIKNLITVDESSNSSNDSNLMFWNLIEKDLSEERIKEFVRSSLPASVSYQTNRDMNCFFCVGIDFHKLKQQFRKCCEDEKCQVKYNILLCEQTNIGSISQKHEHNHLVHDEYNNTNGLPDVIKNIIIDLLTNNPKLYPRQFRSYIHNNSTRLGLDSVSFEMTQIAGFVHRYKNKMVAKKNKVEDVEKYLGDHLYYPTIDPNVPFFFGFPVSDQNKPILGNGASTNHLFIFATTLKLLQINCDTNNQSNIALFHIDGTYKITREGFPMLVFGRSNLNRKIYPFAFGIVSNEEAYDFLHFFQSIKSLCRQNKFFLM